MQVILYMVALLLCHFAIGILKHVIKYPARPIFWCEMIIAVIAPIQGFINYVTYSIPSIQKWIKSNKQDSSFRQDGDEAIGIEQNQENDGSSQDQDHALGSLTMITSIGSDPLSLTIDEEEKSQAISEEAMSSRFIYDLSIIEEKSDEEESEIDDYILAQDICEDTYISRPTTVHISSNDAIGTRAAFISE